MTKDAAEIEICVPYEDALCGSVTRDTYPPLWFNSRVFPTDPNEGQPSQRAPCPGHVQIYAFKFIN